MGKSAITLRSVADAAGVSRMTVSLALRNHPSLSEQTRKRVVAVAQQLGYRPDPDIGKLMGKIREKKATRQRNVIGYLTMYEARDTWKAVATWRDYFEGARRRADMRGYRLDEFWLNKPDMTEKRLGQIIHTRGVEGMLIAPLPLASKAYQEMGWTHLSAVELGYSQRAPALHRVCNHQYQSMFHLVQKLQECGYRRIGLAMCADQDERANHNWRAGYLAAESVGSRRPHVPMLLTASWKKETFQRWIERHKPDVVVTIGKEVQQWLKELGYRVPDDVGLANVDVTSHMKDMTGIDQNSMEVGAAAVDLLISLMGQHERDIPSTPKIMMVEGAFVQGRTTRRPLENPTSPTK